MNFGNRLVEVREQLGFNQNDFALKIEIAPQSLSRYEKNKVKPSIELLTKLTNMFSINTNWILTGNGKSIIENESNDINYKIEIIKSLENLDNNQLEYIYHITKSEEKK